jgi:hypothetical protein
MKKTTLTLIALAMLAAAPVTRAELTPHQFGQVRDWANREGYIYRGVEIAAAGVRVFMFENLASATVAWPQ